MEIWFLQRDSRDPRRRPQGRLRIWGHDDEFRDEGREGVADARPEWEIVDGGSNDLTVVICA